MKIELHAEKYVIRRGEDYFQCFEVPYTTVWISTPYLARRFAIREQAEEALAEICKRSAARRRRKVKA
jgi:hypothetical protein